MNTTPILSRWKRPLLTGFLVLGTLVLFALFPAENRINPTIQSVLLGMALFVALPMVFVRSVLREPFSSLGFRGTARRFGSVAVPLVVIPVLSVWYVILQTYPVSDAYYLPAAVRVSFPFFLLYEIVLVGIIAALYEVFFRGFVQILWLRRAGLWAVPVQVGLFAIFMTLSGGGISWQDAPLLMAAIASGFVASYTGSIPYSLVTSWLVMFLSDVLVLVSR